MAWPLPAILTWALAWAAYTAALELPWLRHPLPPLLGVAVGLLAARFVQSPTRRLMLVAGFPFSWWLIGQGSMPAWAWLLALAALWLLYPVSSWGDAPLFPTRADSLQGLRDAVPLPPGATLLDAGCGAGDGLLALEQAYPDAYLHGIERSWPLRLISAWRCPWAKVRQGDMWRQDWSGFDLVYVFQRPESMPRALAKACDELKPGAWLASLEFEATEAEPTQRWSCADGRTLWLYQAPITTRRSSPGS